MVVGEEGTNGGLWCSPVANTSSPTSSALRAIATIDLIRSCSLGVPPVTGSVVTSPTVKIPNCMCCSAVLAPGPVRASWVVHLVECATTYVRVVFQRSAARKRVSRSAERGLPGQPARARPAAVNAGLMSQTAELAVRVRGLRKQYRDVTAVDGIDLDIRRGEIFALLGPNGAGKTTTVEILAGYRARDNGEAAVLGVDRRSRTATCRSRAGLAETDVGSAAQQRDRRPAVPGDDRAIGPEPITERGELPRARRRVDAPGQAVSLPDPEVLDGPDVKAAQLEHSEHVGRPLADAADGQQRGHEFLVAAPRGGGQVERAVE